ncbi:MAG: hypothetical protein RSD57_07700 [Comamonas sp.]
MKQDKAESQAIADALLRRLQALPTSSWPLDACLAPDMVLFAPPAQLAELVGPREKGIPTYLRDKWGEQRAFFANKAGNTAHSGAVDAEWSRLPLHWRIVMLMMGGVGDLDTDMHLLAARSWQLIPPKEREGIRAALREAFAMLGRTQALRLRTTS